MKYSRQATMDYAKLIDKELCLELIDNLIIKEGYDEGKTTFQGNELVLNMDCVEGKVASIEKRDPNKSMDSAFVSETSDGTTKEIVFVEYRFNYKNLSNLNRSALLEKVTGSTSALGSPANLHEKYYFVFNSNLKQQAINRLGRMNPTIPQAYEAVDINDIEQLFF